MTPKGIIRDKDCFLYGEKVKAFFRKGARPFLRDVDIYIFDEATSALGEYSESIVQEAIQDIGADKTIIVVSHRESSLKLCDRVINLEGLSGMNYLKCFVSEEFGVFGRYELLPTV